MKKLLFFALLFGITTNLMAQASPAVQATGKIDSVNITIDYGQPSVKGRKIWGGLVPYGQVWRAGANTTTSISINKPVTVEGKTLDAGKYALFVIPNEKEWVVIFNKTIKWGAYSYKQEEDVLRITVPVKNAPALAEKLQYSIKPEGKVNIAWENIFVELDVKAAKVSKK
jgi:Protein of unknown function (DUF2911)